MMQWLLLRGLAREQAHWIDFPEIFEKIVPDAKVHCLDLPGVGTERDRPSPLNVPAIVDDTGWGHRGRAHCIGFMQALIQVVDKLYSGNK